MMVLRQGIALALIGLTCTAANGQDTTVKGRETPAQKRADRAEARADRDGTHKGAASKQDDKAIAEYFAGKLMLMDQSTIQLAQLAEERSTNEKVKQFAKMLVEEHTKCSEQLRESAPGLDAVISLHGAGITRTAGFRGTTDADNKSDAIENPAKGDRNAPRNADGAARLAENGATDKDRAEGSEHTQAAHAMTPLHRILTIDRQATDNYVQATTEMLNKYQGAEFDMGFIGFTIGSHTWALAELKAMESVTDEKFQKCISDATTKVEQHLMKAEELSKELGADFAQRVSTTPRTTSNENAPVQGK